MDVRGALQVLSDAGILGGAVIVIWALATSRLIPRGEHEKALRDRDAVITYERQQKEQAQKR